MLNCTDTRVIKLSENDQEICIELVNETEEKRNAAVDAIRTWLTEEVPWITARTEDKYLLPFLRGCKFDLPKTKQKLINYYTMKRDRPEWFTNRNPLLPELKELIKMGIFLPLKRSHDNRMVIIVRVAAHDPKIYKWDDIFKVGKMILDVASFENEQAQIYGVIAIFDMTGMSFSHYRGMTPWLIKKAVFSFQNYHIQPKQLECINAPAYLNIAINIFKGFMTEKMRSRVKVHFGGIEKAKQVVPEEILPVDYGGDEESVASLGDFWFEKLVGYQDWFAEDEIYKANN